VAEGLRLAYVDANQQQFIRCRTLGHAWIDYDSNWKSEFGHPLTLRCERCGMERRDTVAFVTGELVTRHYTRPEGYAFKDKSAPTRSEFRALLLQLRNRERRNGG
jgi:acetone carboxylase gamma subunit